MRVWNGHWGYPVLWIWNLNLAAAFVAVAVFGGNRGWEAGELPLANVMVITAIMFAVTVQILMTIARRRETPLYVSLWYLIGALVWTSINLVLLIIGPYGTCRASTTPPSTACSSTTWWGCGSRRPATS